MTHTPVRAHDVAAFILAKTGEITAMKLQKLLYYAQAWSLVWDDAPLFHERVEAWANGPVVRNVYEAHRGQFLVSKWPEGDAGRLVAVHKETVESVLGYYGDKSAQWLSDLTHSERPWLEAREGIADGVRGEKEITQASMAEYYSCLT